MTSLQNALQRGRSRAEATTSTLARALVLGALGALLAVFFASCGGPTLRPDPILPANYPTAEFTAGGRRWHGLGVVLIPRGKPLDTVGFSVQGYVDGTIRLVSEKCAIDELFRYAGSVDTPYSLPGRADQSCLLSIVTLPEYPGEKDAGVPIRSFKGALWIRVVDDGEEVRAFQSKVSELTDASIDLALPGAARVHAIFRGCGTKFESDLPVSGDQLTLKLSQLFPDLKPTSNQCVLSGRVDIDHDHSFYVTWMVWTYGKDYVPLSVPSVAYKDGKLKVSADQNATVIWLDNDLRYNISETFKFDPSKPHLLRVLTTGGRSVIGSWNGKEWSWSR